LVADANSTDGTPDIALGFQRWLDISVIPGGMPSVGRNRGAAQASSEYILFMDADIEPASESLIADAVALARNNNLHCVTTDILCRGGNFVDRALYASNNLFQHASRWHRPFSTGMFMLFERKRFTQLGGFHEQVHFAEDYLLSKQVARNKFGIVKGGVYTTNRRFEKMGHFRVARLFLKTAANSWNDEFFLRDHEYWQT
jgi:glycosyltransferase involved in cell wall biosynthesis